jgi:hypothetical protein
MGEMTQAALINNPVLLQQTDPLRFQQVRQPPDIPVESGVKSCFSNLQGAFVVHAPTNVAMEGWRCEGNFVRAVALLVPDSIYSVIESMWQDATGGVLRVWGDFRSPQLNPQSAHVDSEHDEMFISSSVLHRLSDPLPQGSAYSRALTDFESTKEWAGYPTRRSAFSVDYEPSNFPRRIPEDVTDNKHYYPQPVTDQHQAAEHAQAVRRVERLTEIQANLGLSMQMLAEVMRVTRPTLYKWFDVEKSISLQNDSIRRLDEVEQLAQKWRALSTAPLGPWVRERSNGGRPLRDLLTAEPLPMAKIERAFSQIVARIVQTPKSKSARLREAGFTRRASHRSLPSDE